ncbi:hypothetical protein UlMin_007841 [Ulmus minor]
MASASTQSSSSSGSIGFGQSTIMASIPSYQMLNHTLPVKLDRTNYILWKSQIDNVVFANGFEDFIDGSSICSMSMIDYIMKVKGAADSLAAIGEPVSEQDQVMNLLGGLGSDYNAVVTAINIRDDKISIEAVHSMLLAFEHRLEQQSLIEQLSTMSANYVSSSNNRDDTWYLDSGASHHLTQSVGNLTSSSPYTGTDKVTIGNGKHLSISNTGHAATNIVTQIMQSCNVSYEKNKNIVCSTVCSSCQLAKSHRLPTHLSISRASKPLELVHTDIWGPALVKSTSGARYFILFLDDYSRYTWFYPLQTKDQALPVFKQFKLQVENQFDAKIKCLQSDNGGEFRSFMTFLQQSGIFHRFSCLYNSAQNGRVERKHRHVVESGLALLAHASLPMKFWQYAF